MSKPKRIEKVARTRRERSPRGHRFEHWLVDHQVYFITARCRDRYPALASDAAKGVFLDRFEHHAHANGVEPWVVSVVDNHYHTIAYLERGEILSRFMQRLHGSVAKLVNDLLPQRRAEFWRDELGKEYFDGCLRDREQLEKAWRYTLIQPARHGLSDNWREYPWTRVYRERDEAIAWAVETGALMSGVPYPRYERKRKGRSK